MQRRTFIKGSTIMAAAMAVSPTISLANDEKNPFGIKSKPRKFSITNSFDIQPSSEEINLWVPLPLDASYQKMVKISYEGTFSEAFISNDNPYGTKLLFAKFDANSKENKLTIKMDMVTQQRVANLAKAKASVDSYPEDVAVFLEGTHHTPINDTIKKFATKITKDANTDLEKARAIYDWTVVNMYRDESVKGCGLGDATRTFEKEIFGGKCTDISSAFVALLRNSGIPAREVFGIRAGKSYISKSCGKADENGFAKISGGQHCRAEFYVGGIGWVPADPADVTKVRLQEKLTDADKKVKDAKEYLWGNWEMNWVAFNYARDFILDPKPVQYPLNMLGYPYAEVGEDVLDYYSPKDFGYAYTSQEIV